MQYSLFQPASCTLRDSGELSPMDKLRHAGPHSLSDTELISLFASPRSFDKVREQLGQYQGIRGLLDNRHRIISNEILFTGTIDGASVYPREVVKRCLQLNAAAIIFSHNHPSGIAEPSQADRQITLKLTQALALVDVRVLDHLVVGDKTVTSMAERGLM